MWWLGTAALEESAWRQVSLAEMSAMELDRLSIETALHRGSSEWHRVGGELVAIESRHHPPSPWSPEARDVWSEMLCAVWDEKDSRAEQLRNSEADHSTTTSFGPSEMVTESLRMSPTARSRVSAPHPGPRGSRN